MFTYVFMCAIVGGLFLFIGNTAGIPALSTAGNIVLFVGGLVGLYQGFHTLGSLS